MDAAIVGRSEELAVARAFLAGVRDGPRGLLLEGEAGIGKTAVWRAVLEEATMQGYRVLTCVAAEADARLSFVGLNDLVGEVVDEVLPTLPLPQREALELALLRRGDAVGRGPEPKTVRVAVRTVIVELARPAPVVLALDDVQWLDAATARALAFAAPRLGGHPVAVLATARAPLASPDPLGLERALEPERLSRIRLGPLSVGAVRALLERRLGYAYPRPTLHRIVQASDGNPLFALEIARALGPAPSLAPGARLPVPETLRDLVVGRVAALSPAARQSLLAAAALSHASAQLVEQTSSAAGLRAAEESGLLRVENGRVAFAHPLYASAVYASAASSRRRALHGRLAPLVVDPEERARHLALATTRPDEHVAAALEAAAAYARARGAWESAADLLEQARSLTPSAQVEVARQRGVRAAEHHVHAGDRPRARALLEDVLRNTPPGSTRSDALRLLADIAYNEDSFTESARLLEEALEHADDPALAVTLELSLCYVHCHYLTDFSRADVHAERGLEQAARLGDPGLHAEALAVRAMVDFLLGRGLDWSRVERALALEDTSRLLPVQVRPSTIAALLALYVGRLDEARERLNELRLAAVESGDESDLAFTLTWLAWLETLSGAFDAAASFAEEAAAQAALTGSEASRGWALAHRALVHAHSGEAAAARADAAAASELAHRLGCLPPLFWVNTALGLLELSLADARAAWAAVAPLTEVVEANGIGELLGAYFVPEAVEALIGLGRLDRAERLLESFEDRARALDRPWALATGARCRSLLSAARGDLDGAQETLEQALVEHARLQMPFELARTLLVQGQIRRRRREKRAARASLAQALSLFEQMGARLWTERARAELAPLGARRPPGELTTRERRVVELAAEGRSNKEIASTLFVTVHTVEVHLSHAYAKLGVRSRTQLADRLAARA